MTVLFLRCLIMYFTVIIAVRLMGKRQIGQLQPEELVVTILISDVATMPLQDMQIPLFQPLLIIAAIVACELLFSVLSLKSRKFRTLVQGHAVPIVKNGTLDQSLLRKIRYTVDDVLEALRLKDVFDIAQAEHIYVESNGSLSVLQKQKPPAAQQTQPVLPCLVISDGKIVPEEFALCGLTGEKLQSVLKHENKAVRDIFLMTYASDGSYHIVEKQVKP